MHSVTDGQTDRLRRQYHTNSRTFMLRALHATVRSAKYTTKLSQCIENYCKFVIFVATETIVQTVVDRETENKFIRGRRYTLILLDASYLWCAV